MLGQIKITLCTKSDHALSELAWSLIIDVCCDLKCRAQLNHRKNKGTPFPNVLLIVHDTANKTKAYTNTPTNTLCSSATLSHFQPGDVAER